MSRNQKLILVVSLAVIVLVFIINGVIDNRNRRQFDTDETMSEEEAANLLAKKNETIEVNVAKGKNERERIEYYAQKFFKSIATKDYEDAYNVLNGAYKERYFPTLQSFIDYCEVYFPGTLGVKYTNIERNGTTYVIWVTISNSTGYSKSTIEKQVVVKENGLNDYEISFSK